LSKDVSQDLQYNHRVASWTPTMCCQVST